jgi:hypothetical protein
MSLLIDSLYCDSVILCDSVTLSCIEINLITDINIAVTLQNVSENVVLFWEASTSDPRQRVGLS